MQLFILILLVDTYLPEKIQMYIMGNGWTLFHFDFIEVEELPWMDTPLKWIELEQENNVLSGLGMRWRSTFNNNYKLIVITLSLVIIHFGVKLIPICKSKKNSNPGKLKRLISSCKTNFLTTMRYSVYTRMFLEANQFILM